MCVELKPPYNNTDCPIYIGIISYIVEISLISSSSFSGSRADIL